MSWFREFDTQLTSASMTERLGGYFRPKMTEEVVAASPELVFR